MTDNSLLKKMGIVLALVVPLFLYNYFNKPSEIKLCNSAPYSVEHALFAAKNSKVDIVTNKLILRPGQCTTKKYKFNGMVPTFYVFTQILGETEQSIFDWITDQVNQELKADSDPSNDQYVLDVDYSIVTKFGDLAICLNERDIVQFTFTGDDDCESHYNWDEGADYTEIRAMKSFYHPNKKTPIFFNANLESLFVWEHPNLPLIEEGQNYTAELNKGLAAAKTLRAAINLQSFNKKEWKGEAPFSPGGAVYDLNGPLSLGVWLDKVAEISIYGKETSLQSGDVILKVNNTPVLGWYDFNQLMINHGLSRSAGIEVPIKYTVLRSGYNQPIQVSDTYFFNSNISRSRMNTESLAFWYGVGNAITFDQTPWAICYGTLGLQKAAKGLSILAEGISSWSQDRKFDKSKVRKVDYIDAKECKWQKTQRLAYARQKNPDVYINSQWFAFFTPSAVRATGNKLIKKTLGAKATKGVLNKAIVTGLLEGAETALWSYVSTAPGSTKGERLKNAIEGAQLGASIGLVSSAAFKAIERFKRL